MRNFVHYVREVIGYVRSRVGFFVKMAIINFGCHGFNLHFNIESFLVLYTRLAIVLAQ